MIEHELNLKYSLSAGWMQPYVEALQNGTALGRRCVDCELTSFPPLYRCPCGSNTAEWSRLPGDATILFRTSGLDGDFALVRFTGADTSAVVKLRNLSATATCGRIRQSRQTTPALILHPERTETST